MAELTVEAILEAHQAFKEFEAELRDVRTVSREQMMADIEARSQFTGLDGEQS